MEATSDATQAAEIYLPSPAEIERQAAAIRAGWSPRELARRRRVIPMRAVPTVGVKAKALARLEGTLAHRRSIADN